MNIRELEHALLEGIGSLDEGFTYRKSQRQYMRKILGMVHLFRIQLVKWREDVFAAVPGVGLGCPEVNKEFNRILGRDIEVNGHTCGFGVQNESRTRGYYPIEAESDIAVAAAHIRADYVEIARPFFEQHRTLREMETYINRRNQGGKFFAMSVGEACLGLIAAKLAGNPELGQIFTDNFALWQKSQRELAKPIETVYRALTPETALAIRPSQAAGG